ncbi:glycoside hydrolase family 43 protein [Thermoanaerobacterium thermosaccharolyticum]|uniref:glycoside hydrolase family 43 protein n=1 Tax=Thermoanaerobacterium thermosaccharolyticum TaxID=1517 RepID=UPI003DA901CA
MQTVQNPVLKGFNPDPSIVRVNQDYYIAVSTFEWFPGVHIYHSRDLVNWEFVTAPLSDETKVNLTGIDSACGIWAPNLTYCNGKFYLIYTIVYTNRSRYKDPHNFIITADNINGPWSMPVFLNCSGFDPALFHDENKKWLVNMALDYRIKNERFAGIDLQEYDEEKQELIGPVYRIFKGSEIGKTEGPNIIKHGEYYYLTVAEGGTGFDHCVTVARSKFITGPYEIDPENPVLTSRNSSCSLQRAGHGQVVDSTDGRWYMVHLCSRPISGYSILGRETAIQNVIWNKEGWPRLEKGGNKPFDSFEIPYVTKKEKLLLYRREDFDEENIPYDFMTLRNSPETCHITTKERKGWLRIYGGNSLSSKFKQGLLARRQQHFDYECITKMQFSPRSYRHLAGLVCYYNYDNYHYLKVSKDENFNICINITTADNGNIIDSDYIILEENVEIFYLKAVVHRESLIFYYSLDSIKYIQVGNTLDMTILSDEHVDGNGFTGAMIGVCCQDLMGDGIYADFDWFEYREL